MTNVLFIKKKKMNMLLFLNVKCKCMSRIHEQKYLAEISYCPTETYYNVRMSFIHSGANKQQHLF